MEKNGVSSTRVRLHITLNLKSKESLHSGEKNTIVSRNVVSRIRPEPQNCREKLLPIEPKAPCQRRWKKMLPSVWKVASHQESTGNDENSGNKVGISKKRHRAKEPFFYEGEKYVSLGQCCEIYGINETSVRAGAWRIHCTWEEAVKHFIKKKSNADELKKIFVYKGKEYISKCC